MVSRRTTVRGYWLMLALVGLFGMFTAKSTNTLKFNHLPGRVYARAGGTASSLAQRDRIEKVAAHEDEAKTAPAVAEPVPTRPAATEQQEPQTELLPCSPGRWPPPLLFRPPPALSVVA